MSKLRETLEAAGFLDVTGMEERVKGKLQRVTVGKTRTVAYMVNQNVVCFRDANGHSWIRPNTFDSDESKCLDDIFHTIRHDPAYLKKPEKFGDQFGWGMHVPFSNDGGKFTREVWPHKF